MFLTPFRDSAHASAWWVSKFFKTGVFTDALRLHRDAEVATGRIENDGACRRMRFGIDAGAQKRTA
jgi:hypothetical protein